MLVQFTVGNFLSFNGKRTLSLEARGISELKTNIANFKPEKILRSAVIYGANSSGKSNLIKALDRMRDVVLDSVKLNDTDELDYSPFLLSSETENQPTFFEVVFWQDSTRYRYGFEYTLEQIVNEWLFAGKSEKTEKTLFIRTLEGIGVTDKFKEGIKNESKTNDNRLFISLVAQLGGSVSKKILEFFNDCNVLSGLEHNYYTGFTMRMLHKNLNGCDESLKLYQKLKLGFKEINALESDFNPTEIPDYISAKVKSKLIKQLSGKKGISLKTVHNKFDKKGNVIDFVLFDKEGNESQGTNKIIDLSGPIFDTLSLGKVLIIDELDAKLHPLITTRIVELFNSPESNPNNAQLIFATHDTNLLGEELFRRDQIWFTEKDEYEQTDLYSLYDFNLPDGSKVRNDSNLEKNYIRGRYGAIPFITN
ncbi:AAA family ATPase [Elizabethkingia anophelis]|uniref:AAA family ATPase n=1 Tax=Elizabethkingia anophelis TaxID=1117645 RepID=UPI0021A4453A|nr:ATP-binding protein [Elizabethkingia anophelis]